MVSTASKTTEIAVNKSHIKKPFVLDDAYNMTLVPM